MVADPKRSEEFYLRVFGGEVIRSGEPTIIQIANSWVVFIYTYIQCNIQVMDLTNLDYWLC